MRSPPSENAGPLPVTITARTPAAVTAENPQLTDVGQGEIQIGEITETNHAEDGGVTTGATHLFDYERFIGKAADAGGGTASNRTVICSTVHDISRDGRQNLR